VRRQPHVRLRRPRLLPEVLPLRRRRHGAVQGPPDRPRRPHAGLRRAPRRQLHQRLLRGLRPVERLRAELTRQIDRRYATASSAARSNGSSWPGNTCVAASTPPSRLGSLISPTAASISSRPPYSSWAACTIA